MLCNQPLRHFLFLLPFIYILFYYQLASPITVTSFWPPSLSVSLVVTTIEFVAELLMLCQTLEPLVAIIFNDQVGDIPTTSEPLVMLIILALTVTSIPLSTDALPSV